MVGYISTEGDPPTDYDVWLIKTDSLGSMEWNRTYGGASIDMANSVIQANDGGYVMAGLTYSYGVDETDFYLVKTDSTGNMQWNRTYGGTLADLGYAVVQTVDGGYALAGYSNYYINSSYAVIDFWLVKTVSGGDVNGDGGVDIFDLSIVGRAYFTFIGDPDYNPDADLNEDGLVDMRDLTIVASNYGTG